MSRTAALVASVALGTLVGCRSEEASRPPSSDPPGRPVTVELFAPGVVSTEMPEFATAFTPSGDTVFFNRTPPDRSRLDLYFARRTEDGWSAPRRFAPLEGVTAIDPFVSFDGRHLYFSSDRGGAGTLEGSFNLWRTRLGAGAPAMEPLPVNTDSSEVYNSFARDGRMVFSSRRDGVRKVYEVDADGAVREVAVGPGEDGSASNPAIHPDGRILVFSATESEGAPDLYVSCRSASGWGPARRLPDPINSSFTEFAPAFGGEYLYFSSERPGVVGAQEPGVRPPGDIYRTPLAGIEAFCGQGGGTP